MAGFEAIRWAEALVGAAAGEASVAVSVLRTIDSALGDSRGRISGPVEAARLDAILGRALAASGSEAVPDDGRAKPGRLLAPGGAEAARRVAVMLARRRLLKGISAVAAAARALVDEREGVLRVRADSAVPVADDLRERLRGAIAREFSRRSTVRTVEIEERVDPALLGGVRLDIGWERIDGTLLRRLESLAAATGAEKRGGEKW